MIRRLKRLFDSNELAWTPPLLPWANPRARKIRGYRRLARRVLRRRLVAERGWFCVLVQSAVWPAMAGLKAWLAPRVTRVGAGGNSVHGQGSVDRWWVQIVHNISISDQHMLGFDLPGPRSQVQLCLPCREHQVLLDLANCNTGLPAFEDKRGFARFCAAHDLPTVDVFLEGDGGDVVQHQAPPAADLFLKPADLGCGEGITTVPFDATSGRWRGMNGESLGTADLASYATRVQAGHPWVLQPRLANGPAWAGFSQGGLCTVRVVTGRLKPHAPPEIIGGFMRFPRRDAVVDNLSAGGIAAEFNLDTGRLAEARDDLRPDVGHATHPDTGARIAGEIIPGWEKIRALALRAHEPLHQLATIGWDVALPGEEPILIELNRNWGLFVTTPLGATRYVEIMSAWLEQPTPEIAAFLHAALNA